MYFLLLPLFAYVLSSCASANDNFYCVGAGDNFQCYDKDNTWQPPVAVDATTLPPVLPPYDAGIPPSDASVGESITAILLQQGDWSSVGHATWKPVGEIEYEGEKDMVLGRMFPESDPCEATPEGYFNCGAYTVACPPTADVVSDFVQGDAGLYRLNGVVLPSGVVSVVGREFRCEYKAEGQRMVLGEVK